MIVFLSMEPISRVSPHLFIFKNHQDFINLKSCGFWVI